MKFVRRRPRAELDATAFLTADGGEPAGPYLVENLSASGVLVRGSRPYATGTAVGVTLSFVDGSRLEVAGTIVRAEDPEPDRFHLAIAFRELTAAVEERLAGVVGDALARSRSQGEVVLVVAASEGVRRELEAQLAERGRRAVLAGTALDAARALQAPHLAISAVVVELAFFEDAAGRELLALLEEELAGVRRIVFGGRPDAEAMEAAIEAGRAHAALVTPWTPDELAAAISPDA